VVSWRLIAVCSPVFLNHASTRTLARLGRSLEAGVKMPNKAWKGAPLVLLLAGGSFFLAMVSTSSTNFAASGSRGDPA
jgi:hypothetical protein